MAPCPRFGTFDIRQIDKEAPDCLMERDPGGKLAFFRMRYASKHTNTQKRAREHVRTLMSCERPARRRCSLFLRSSFASLPPDSKSMEVGNIFGGRYIPSPPSSSSPVFETSAPGLGPNLSGSSSSSFAAVARSVAFASFNSLSICL